MDSAVLQELIRLNVAMEGSLRVLAERPSPQALSLAAESLARMNTLFASLHCDGAPAPEAEATAVKEDEAVEPQQKPLAPAPQPGPTPAPEAVEPIRVEEAISRNECRDLRKAFTLNDKFLFRRELFGGSEQEFADTIDLIMAMHSADEAREYLIDDLQWDEQNPVVQDFMDIITNHFSAR